LTSNVQIINEVDFSQLKQLLQKIKMPPLVGVSLGTKNHQQTLIYTAMSNHQQG
jgi:hypothetical protein